MSKPHTETAIILVNWNGTKDTIECLESLKLLKDVKFKVIVVDNCSRTHHFDNLKSYIIKSFGHHLILSYDEIASFEDHQNPPDIFLLKLDVNTGFTGGNNIGMEVAKRIGSRFYWLLNNDTVVDPNTLKELLISLAIDGKNGIAGSFIYSYDKKEFITFGSVKIIPWKGYGLRLKSVKYDYWNVAFEVDSVAGASTLIDARVVDDIGTLDENYFAYAEETDFNIRAKKAGWKIISVPNSLVYHKVGGSLSHGSPIRDYYCTRNVLYLVKKNFCRYLPIAILYHFFRITCIEIVIRKKRIKHLSACIQGFIDFMFKRMGRCTRKL